MSGDLDFLNAQFRAELERFKAAEPDLQKKLVASMAEAGALDWMIEVCEKDDDPDLREMAEIAKAYRDNQP